ncbi:RraA family protein [Chloroflexi bacterium TSY]|nr:RraA family protein [Chloroflexi bacterium TSY]
MMNIEQLLQLKEFSTTTIATAISMLNLRDPAAGFTGPDTRALMPDLGPQIGVAVTARLDTTTGGTEMPETRFYEWLLHIREVSHSFGAEQIPVFVVVEAVGQRPRNTVLGHVMAELMKLAGAVALLTNGSVRDIEGLREVPLACWAAGLAPMHGTMRWLDFDLPVVVDGMTVRPGDFVHADVNGATVMPVSAVGQVYEQAIAVKERDRGFYAKMAEPGALDAFLSSRLKSGDGS